MSVGIERASDFNGLVTLIAVYWYTYNKDYYIWNTKGQEYVEHRSKRESFPIR